MRFYDIIITKDGTRGVIRRWTSFVNNQTLPGAQLIEIDIPVAPSHTPYGGSYVRIWGISLADISQASNLNFLNIQVYGGMKRGLPLANPNQSGLLVQGKIFQAYGNWIGLDQTLDLILVPGNTGSITAPANLVLDWKANQQLASALDNTFRTAYPALKRNIAISPKLVRPNDETTFYPTLEQLGTYVYQTSINLLGAAYAGVSMLVEGDTISAFDGTVTAGAPILKTKAINFTDLIGQPTWLEGSILQIKTVMRGDLDIGNQVTLPRRQGPNGTMVANALATNTSSSPNSQVNLTLAFVGTFTVRSIRHIGNSRQADASSWVSVIDLIPNSLSSAAGTNGGL